MTKGTAERPPRKAMLLSMTLLLAAIGCRADSTGPQAMEVPRRSIVCAPTGITVTSADTVSVAPDGSCPIGFDTMIWV